MSRVKRQHNSKGQTFKTLDNDQRLGPSATATLAQRAAANELAGGGSSFTHISGNSGTGFLLPRHFSFTGPTTTTVTKENA